MPDIQDLFVYGITGAFVALMSVLLWVQLWSSKAPSKRKSDDRAA